MADRLGQSLGNYDLVQFLGQGGFAEVYLGKHRYLHSHAALKLLRISLTDVQAQQFLLEAQILVRLRHPHIVRVLEFAVEQGTPVLMMDYAPGGTLRQCHPRGSRLPLALVCNYLQQVAEALQYAHNHNVIHRDVKPENILLSGEQHLLLSDFGLALLAPSPDLLSTQRIAGTLPYTAPEQLRGKPSFASDQYALGIVTYEWLSGKRPFEGSYWRIICHHLYDEPPPLREQCPELPASVEAVVARALAKDPKDRFVSVQAFAQAFTRAYQESVVNDDSDSQVTVPLNAISRSSYIPSPHHASSSLITLQDAQKIFISASPADAGFATRLETDLKKQGIDVLNHALVDVSHQFKQVDALREAIRTVQCVFVVVSPHTRSSQTIKEHLRIAGMYQRRLVFVWAAGGDMVALLLDVWGQTGHVDVIDAREQRYEIALKELVACLREDSAVTPPRKLSQSASLSEPPEPRNPYKGLRAFGRDDMADFFGRDLFVENLVEAVEGILPSDSPKVSGSRLLAVMGPSGSGKSSVIRAGLLPRLQNGAVLESQKWVYLEPMVPGTHPVEGLALTLFPHFPERSLKSIREDLEDDALCGLHLLATHLVTHPEMKVVLVVDQFEELFSQVVTEEIRQRFLDLLITAVTEPSGSLMVLLTLRADFYDRLLSYPVLFRLIQDHQHVLLPMDLQDLRTVIEQPAALPDVQLTFEGNLVGDLLFETQGQVGALPLLEFTLDQLFQQRRGHLLTLSSYHEMGGVKGALSRHAEQTYTTLPSEEHRRLARPLFMRLIDPGVTEQDTTRRRAALSEFSLDDPAQTRLLQETLDTFIAARLLTTNEIAGTTTIEVSHEALIREWTRLSVWLREAREDIKLQQIISKDAADWIQRGKPVDRVYRGTELIEAKVWAERNMPSTNEVAFLQASVAEREQQEATELHRKAMELKLQRRVVGRQRLLVTVLSIFSVVVIVLALFAQVGRQQAEVAKQDALLQASIADSRALAAQANSALVSNQLDQALLLSLKANQTHDTYDARDSLLRSLEYSPRIMKMLHTISFSATRNMAPNTALTFAPDGRSLLSLGPGGGGTIWNMQTWAPHPLPFGIDFSNTIVDGGGLAISPNGQIVASSGGDGLWLWDLKTGTQLGHLTEGAVTSCPSRPPTFEPEPCTLGTRAAVAFRPDGMALAATQCSQISQSSGCTQGEIVLWNIASAKPTGQVFLTQDSIPMDIVFSPDGNMLAVSNEDGTVQLWSIASKSLIAQFSSSGPFPQGNRQEENINFSPDGKLLAWNDVTGTISVWDIASKMLRKTLSGNHPGAGQHILFSPDSTILASVSSDDKTIRLWNVATGTSYSQMLVGHRNSVSSLAFSQDSKILASIDEDGTIILWNIVADSLINQKQEYSDQDITSVIFSTDGKIMITGDSQSKIRLHSRATGDDLGTLDASIYPVHPQEDSRSSNITSLALSPDEQIFASGRFDGVIILWNMQTRQAITHFASENRPNDLVFSPSGRMLALGYDSGTVLLWDIARRKVLRSFTHHATDICEGHMSSLDFSRDGKILAMGDSKEVVLWDITTGKRIGQPFVGHATDVAKVVFSPDRQTLASVDTNNTLILWNIATKKALHQPLLNVVSEDSQFQHCNAGLTFSPDGQRLALASFTPTDGSGTSPLSIVVWDVATFEPLMHALEEPSDGEGTVTFSPNGQQLLSFIPANFSSSSHTTLWNVNMKSWQGLACAIANRNFTAKEWTQFAPLEAYQPVCPQFPVDDTVITERLNQAHAESLASQRQAASSDYAQAVRWSTTSYDASINNDVCWQGSLDNFAKVVLPACNRAIELEPNSFLSVNFYDSRGIARALVGDKQGAIADFKLVVDSYRGYGCVDIEQRKSWLQVLEAGRNPFDAATLKALRKC